MNKTLEAKSRGCLPALPVREIAWRRLAAEGGESGADEQEISELVN
jgi:hypothetical protein